MIIALFALAVVMIVGGIASVIQGFPFVRLESGLAMTIAGATTASAGAVLLGIATVAIRLKRLEAAWVGGREAALGEPAPYREITAPTLGEPAVRQEPPAKQEPTAAEPIADDVTIGTLPVRQRPSLGAAGLGAAGLGLSGAALGSLAGLSATRAGAEPSAAEPHRAAEAEPLLPDLLPPVEEVAPPHVPPSYEAPTLVHDTPSVIAPHEDDLFIPAAPEPAAMTAEPPILLRPSFVATPEPVIEAPAADETHAEAPAEEALQVVGTYASGGNTYVMFSNGSIEADTPRGRYTFASLDELKVFVESGGESDARGAA
ncbi:hypothetical protein G3T14_19060 [Methylobacterium sp. BTF04]|uniref:hypothetical protein n=1 Tax=Methylobacterium sp. BTF04 TaxID=2708300 RepID=UPI0013D0C7F4|nr:hypothetical protein [Methylobacterium sp. BTF04]NEU14213.1 hypothetical protein [Methylobacterium sp. BTF04]